MKTANRLRVSNHFFWGELQLYSEYTATKRGMNCDRMWNNLESDVERVRSSVEWPETGCGKLQNGNFKLQLEGFELKFSDSELQPGGFELKFDGFKIQLGGFELQNGDFKLQLEGFELKFEGFKLQNWNFKLQLGGFDV